MEKRPHKRLADMNVLWYYLSITHLLHAWVGVTSREGRFPMSKRLVGYDYSQPGFYFVTICTQQHRLVFSTIVEGQVYLKGPGQIAQSVWVTLPRRFAHVKLHEYVFMPNHMHAIIELTDLDSAHVGPRAALWEIVRVFKAATSYHIRRSEGQPWFAWQEEYYDSVVRTDAASQQIRQYILDNPVRWTQDRLYRSY
ncbi:MAG: transposase [Ktedonobacteraceae bacterium]